MRNDLQSPTTRGAVRRRRAAVTCAAVLGAVWLAGCGQAGPEDGGMGEAPVPTTADTETPVEGDDGTGADQDADAVPGGGASPDPGRCVEVPEPVDGLYVVADAGTVTVAHETEDGRLVVGAVQPAGGWEYEVTEDIGDEVEVEFRREGAELDLEVEIDDGVVTAEICADDD